MNPKLPASLKSLHNWTTKITDYGKQNSSHKLRAFASDMDLKSFLRYYKELAPFITALKGSYSGAMDQLIVEYLANEGKLVEEMPSESALSTFLANFRDSGITDLLFVLTDINNNVGNLVYQVNINAE